MKSGGLAPPPPLHSLLPLRRRHFNRLFAAVYTSAILCLLYHHIHTLIHSTKELSNFLITLSLFIADVILAYMWTTAQAFRMNPVHRQSFPENLHTVLEDRKEFPAVDIFICTADPYKEPPMDVANTALSVIAYDYPPEKLAVYVSDDGGSELTMFAFMEAAKFAKLWLPFCRQNKIIDRCPDAYFSASDHALTPNTLEIKMKYESMKLKVENAVERGKLSDEYISSEEGLIFSQFRAKDFARQNHPSVIQVLLNSNQDLDVAAQFLPNLIYVSRQKSKEFPHHFKAGALNTLLRVSGSMTNSPIILTLDCDMYSNDPLTAQRALCYLLPDKSNRPNCGYVQFPQRYHGLNHNDIYASEHKRLFLVNPIGMDGLNGPSYVGTGCFFFRRVFFGGPSSYIQPEISELGPDHVVEKPINDKEVLGLAHRVAGCNYENQTNWGSKLGFRYGSLVEDYYTGYRLQCEGWQSIFCDPIRPAFLGDVPITLNDVLSQAKRWSIGLLEVAFSKYSPSTFGIKAMGVLMGQAYAQYALWAMWSIPIIIYAFLPSLALLQGLSIFPTVYEARFVLYAFLFVGAYIQDCVDFISTRGTFGRWWSDQRMWLIRGPSSYLFGCIEYATKCLGMATNGFNVTSKVMDDEQSKRYNQGMFEFGVVSPMFVPLATAAILNMVALVVGFVHVWREGGLDRLFVQIFVAGFGVLNSLPFYEAMVLRSDKGRMPTKTTIISALLVGLLYEVASFLLKS